MRRMKSAGIAALAAGVLFLGHAGAAEQAHHGHEAPAIALSKEVKGLLSEEMNAIQQGMMDLVPAIAAGEWDRIIGIARKIEGSYILKQKLTKPQIDELHHALPQGFRELDHRFHKTAGMLAHVAEVRDAELVSFYFYRMNEACTQCHSRYVADRFPGLAQPARHDHH